MILFSTAHPSFVLIVAISAPVKITSASERRGMVMC